MITFLLRRTIGRRFAKLWNEMESGGVEIASLPMSGMGKTNFATGFFYE